MSDYLDIVEESDGYRVRLEPDSDPTEPSDSDAMVPVLRIDSDGWGKSAEAFNNQANGFEDAFNHFAESASGRTLEVFERFVRIFHGATKVETWNVGISNEYGYLGFDTAEWRETVGAPLDRLKAEDYLEEVRDWATGEVYGYIVEKQFHYTKTYLEDPDYNEEDTEWSEVEDGSCWGLVGRNWAEQAARDALKQVATP